MPKVHSHYENLKVARDARPEAIRAAYRSLSGKYHPDHNADNADAVRIMSIINVAYEELSDPVRRRAHDGWIVQAERETDEREPRTASSAVVGWRRDAPFAPHEPPPRLRTSREREPDRKHSLRDALAHLGRYGVAYGLVVAAACYFLYEEPVLLPSMLGAVAANFSGPALVQVEPYPKPTEAPNGRQWPDGSGYVDGYERRNTDGLSELTIDNGGNDADTFAKLVSLDTPEAYPVRVVLVRAHSRLKLTQITSGTYDLRYRNLDDGSLSRSPSFTLEDVPTESGPGPSSMTLLLDKADGSQGDGLAETEF